MEILSRYASLILIILGTLTLVVTHIVLSPVHNGLLVAGLLLIVAGIVWHIRSIRHDSRY